MSNDSGQAITEYALIMVALVTLAYTTAQLTEALYPGAFLDLVRGFGVYSDNYDFVLSLPFP